MKNKKLIDLYKEWMETGEMSREGLCESVPKSYTDTLQILTPDLKDIRKLFSERMPTVYWAYGISYEEINDPLKRWRDFSPLRQTIVLLICAIHNEL